MRKNAFKRVAWVILDAMVGRREGGIIKSRSVTRPQFGFEITFPEAWKVTDGPAATAIEGTRMLRTGVKSGACVLVGVEETHDRVDVVNSPESARVEVPDLPPALSETYAEIKSKFLSLEREINAIRDRLKFEQISKDDFYVGVNKGRKTTFSLMSSELDGRVRNVSFVLDIARREYRVTAAALETDFDKYAQEIDAIVASFKIIEAK